MCVFLLSFFLFCFVLFFHLKMAVIFKRADAYKHWRALQEFFNSLGPLLLAWFSKILRKCTFCIGNHMISSSICNK